MKVQFKIKEKIKNKRDNEILKIEKNIRRNKKNKTINNVIIDFYKEKSALDTFAVFYNVVVVVFFSTLAHGVADFYFSVKNAGTKIKIDESYVNLFNIYIDFFVAVVALIFVISIRKRRKNNYLLEYCLKKRKLI